MIQLELLDALQETDPERKEEAIKRSSVIFQIQQIIYDNNFAVDVAWSILANVARVYLQELQEKSNSEASTWLEIFSAIAKEPILCRNCMIEEIEQATKQ
jgi:hypothetical protein